MAAFRRTQASLLEELNIQHIFLRPAEARSPVLIKLLTRRLMVTLRAMETVLAEQETLLAEGFSAADTMMGFNIPAVFRFVKAEGYPALVAYAARMAARPAHARALALSGPDTLYTQDFYEIPHG